jgi:hypothetical protein
MIKIQCDGMSWAARCSVIKLCTKWQEVLICAEIPSEEIAERGAVAIEIPSNDNRHVQT